MKTNQPDHVTIAALRQLVARSYDALARSHSALGDGVATDSAQLLHDLRAVVEAPGIPDPSGRTQVAQLGQLQPGTEFYPLAATYTLPTWRGCVEAQLDDGTTRYTLPRHRTEPCHLRSSMLVRAVLSS